MTYFYADVESVVRVRCYVDDEVEVEQAVADGDYTVVETVSGPDVVKVSTVDGSGKD